MYIYSSHVYSFYRLAQEGAVVESRKQGHQLETPKSVGIGDAWYLSVKTGVVVAEIGK